MGWLGDRSQLMHLLRSMGCDRTADNQFCVDGTIAAFMGNPSEYAEIVVGDDAVFYVDGKPRNLSSALAATSYGLWMAVI